MNDKIRELFARYGFLRCPLSDRMIRHCVSAGLTLDQVYGVGCDVYAGWSFRESFEAAMEVGEA